MIHHQELKQYISMCCYFVSEVSYMQANNLLIKSNSGK